MTRLARPWLRDLGGAYWPVRLALLDMEPVEQPRKLAPVDYDGLATACRPSEAPACTSRRNHAQQR